MYAQEDDVFVVLPAELRRPADVQVDGKQGVTQSTFNAFTLRYRYSIDADIKKAGLPIPAGPYHPLLVAAHAHMIAGAVMRKFTSMQQQYKDAYATGNIFLRQYITDQQRDLGVALGAPSFVVDTDPLPDASNTGFPDL
ncbi:hypothetical protein [Deinococcus kurensis]|uniref:hypothetical protein n=1 Tax=Deinococcus kurensis TaxID=2662757 RepID=UPI0012D31050|nr:hypothetical protein [Deinococcus kurensis]